MDPFVPTRGCYAQVIHAAQRGRPSERSQVRARWPSPSSPRRATRHGRETNRAQLLAAWISGRRHDTRSPPK